MSVLLALLSAFASPLPVAHEMTVEHRGATYQVRYRPQVSLTMRTVGLSVGTRPTAPERCRWSATVRVERQLNRLGTEQSLATLLPPERVITGQRLGHCRQLDAAAREMLAADDAALRAHVVAVAESDRPAVIAAIDAVRALN